MIINGYTLTSELETANSGFSKWGFATKNGKEYFIKELIKPVYPMDRTIMSEEQFNQRREFCSRYEEKFRSFFIRLNKASRGNLVRINEFFRQEGRYYIISEKIEGDTISMEEISRLDGEKKHILLKSVAHCFHDLHSAGIVHFDVKPANVLVKKTINGNYAAKVIDFDSGFLIGDVLKDEDLGGDLAYLAPETFLALYGEDVQPTEKVDIFALGLIFHEYYSGTLPPYDESEYDYPYEAALDNGVLKPDRSQMPSDIADLIESMLDANPENRPSAGEIVRKLNENHAKNKDEIKTVSIHFSGEYGKTVFVTADKIRYQNTLHPSITSSAHTIPASYTEPKEKSISSDEFNRIITEIVGAGMFDILTPHHETNTNSDAICHALVVTFQNGSTHSYTTYGEPSGPFHRIAEILSVECDFPAFDPSWVPSVEKPTGTGSSHNSADWFAPAGDL